MSRKIVSDEERLIRKELRVVNKLINLINDEVDRRNRYFKEMLNNNTIKLGGNDTTCVWRE
mgnify:CR=1 FL=1